MERGPWATTWDNGRGSNERIPYTLAVAEGVPHRDAVLEAAAEYEAICAAERARH